METEPPVIDHLILLRPEDDVIADRQEQDRSGRKPNENGKHARLEPIALDAFAHALQLPALARRRDAKRCRTATAAEPGRPDPGSQCEKLLEQVCMPVQG